MRLSVIVPVYNVEKYLNRCIDSVLNQTISDLETILVVNGKIEDKSLEICKDYEKRDNRVKLYVIKEAGAAAARNTGIDNATGEFIGFVDADDWIEPDMFAVLLDGIEKNNADIAICRYYEYFEREKKGFKRPYTIDFGKEEVKDPDIVIGFIASGQLENFLWNKLFKRELFENVRMPHRAIFEDASILYKLVHKSNRVWMTKDTLYHYNRRSGSLTNVYGIEKRIDSLDYYDELLGFLKENFPKFVTTSGLFLYRLCATMANAWIKSDKVERIKTHNLLKKKYAYYKKERSELFKQYTPMQKMAMEGFMSLSYIGCLVGLAIEWSRRKILGYNR